MGQVLDRADAKNDEWLFALTSDNATPANRPQLTIVYHLTTLHTPLAWDITQKNINVMDIDSIGYGDNDTSLITFELILSNMMGGLDTLYVNTDSLTYPFTFTAINAKANYWTKNTQVIKGLIPGYTYQYKSRGVYIRSKSSWSALDSFTVQGTLRGGVGGGVVVGKGIKPDVGRTGLPHDVQK